MLLDLFHLLIVSLMKFILMVDIFSSSTICYRTLIEIPISKNSNFLHTKMLLCWVLIQTTNFQFFHLSIHPRVGVSTLWYIDETWKKCHFFVLFDFPRSFEYSFVDSLDVLRFFVSVFRFHLIKFGFTTCWSKFVKKRKLAIT